MEIRFSESPIVCNAMAGETILLACARGGVMLSAPCGGRRRCGKCRARLLSGQVSGDVPDAEGFVRACLAEPVSDIVIAGPGSGELLDNEATRSAAARTPPSPGRPPFRRAGVALDIGTTTVSARLVDLDAAASGEVSPILDTLSELNDQRPFGADVMSRIGAARSGKTGELFGAINRQTERILKTFLARWKLPQIEKLAVSGNTAMQHLFLNVDPSGMGEAPFTPAFLEERELKGNGLSLSAESVTVLPSIAAFIGGDIVAGLASLDILNSPGPSLLIDIGTNGEMALCNEGRVFCCAAAAGPAFEGAEISCGMGGVKGAVSGVGLVDGKLALTVIGNVPPAGICGSGLIDAVALMLAQGIIDETGSMAGLKDGYPLAPGVSISGRDIRQFQLAKSAIFSGIRLLCKNAGLKPGEVRNVYIAGGFGFFIDKRNAARAGIFPEEFLDAVTVAGNLSLRGAEECLSSKGFIARCKEIIARCRAIDLAADPAFMDEFAENMLFGEPARFS